MVGAASTSHGDRLLGALASGTADGSRRPSSVRFGYGGVWITFSIGIWIGAFFRFLLPSCPFYASAHIRSSACFRSLAMQRYHKRRSKRQSWEGPKVVGS